MIDRIRHLSLSLGLLVAGASLAPVAAAMDSSTQVRARYVDALAAAIRQNWLAPDGMSAQSCLLHIVQIPGGDVISVKADPGCPYDAAGKRSVENAVLRAQPLPYKGYESVFQRQLDFTFRPQ